MSYQGWLKSSASVTVLMLAGATWTYNTYTQSEEAVAAAWAQVRNVEQRRMDLIPALVRVTEAYAAHERAVIDAVQGARDDYLRAAVSPSGIQDLKRVDTSLTQLVQLRERYPALQASRVYRNLDLELRGSANRIAVERHRYNEVAADHRALLRSFPWRVFTKAQAKPPLFEQLKPSNS